MNRSPVYTFATLALLASLAGGQTPANKVRGKVIEVSGDTIKVDTADGQQSVKTGEATKYSQVNETQSGFSSSSLDKLTAGTFVSITLEAGDDKIASKVWAAPDETVLAAAFAKGSNRPAKADAKDDTKPDAKANAKADGPASQPNDGSDVTVGRVKSGSMANRFMELHEQYVARAKQGDIDVVFLGDSITQRWEKAPELWKSRYEPLKAVNFGISGDVIQHVLWRVEHGELDGISPKVVILMIGTNNSKRHDSAPIVVGIKHLVDVIHQKVPSSKVLLLAIFPRNKSTDTIQQKNIDEVNPELAKMDNGTWLKFLNINKSFEDEQGKVRKDLFSDLLHPDPAGLQVWADAMQPTLDELLKQ